MSKAFKKHQHCGDTYYTGIHSHVNPVCGECGEKIDTVEAVEIYEDNILNDTKPVETYETVEQYENR